jgi:hypothetical protein
MRIVNKKGVKQDLTMFNGSFLYLHGQMHSIIKQMNVSEDRMSFNFFFTTSEELQGVNS